MPLPLFPLHSVLFPGGLLPLRIFEARYLDMVRDCLRDDSGFGICLIESGDEVGPAPRIYRFGTMVRIVDWDRRADGLLGIVVQGEQRLHVLDYAPAPNGLLRAEVALLPSEAAVPMPADQLTLSELLRRMLDQLGPPFSTLEGHYEDAVWVGARLTELLPLQPAAKQHLYELKDPLLRLDELRTALRRGLA
ncbi:peptidase S16 [Acidihalobacter yilgarnensis]|uniref:Peptidase S16 n=1 Tax=Acidihalobacter yilgarnensis TaxID=2819280 RepID=A0A1D8ILA6_9GAMM|nr:LON peptidase substrate-binding domain-containing protein [Acidihalobacter yilgarnensis]AOU97262.1 peptidase S16 [Acidihalobacter yilgarnensis]